MVWIATRFEPAPTTLKRGNLMKHNVVILAGMAASFLFSAGLASAQTDEPLKQHRYGTHKQKDIRPLTVSPAPAPVGPGAVAAGIGGALASPFNSVGSTIGGPVGAGVGVIGSTITGATTVIGAPFAGLAGGPVGISANPAPPLPIKARFANTGAVIGTFDEGFQQDVPVDRSGPIYMIDNTGHDRVVTPFSLVAFPVTAVTSIASTPFHAVSSVHP